MKNQAIDPNYLKAVRQKQKLLNRLEHPSQRVPAYVRRHLTPRIDIGILRDPMQPIHIEPTVHTPKKEKALFKAKRPSLITRIRFAW